ncbi:MAG: WD40 repeat domain-containing protein [Cyanobacterium sp. T60_A2020_053]|nr:WD40 repeat domain-containing protein [Cyanobacterium sp. T60_A2020_053]
MSDDTTMQKQDSRHELRELVNSQLRLLLEQNNKENIMIFKNFTRLQWGEYALNFMLFIMLITNNNLRNYPLLLLIIILVLMVNLINRISLENRTKKRIAAALKIQLNKFTEKVEYFQTEIEKLKRQSALIPPPFSPPSISLSDDEIIASLQRDMNNVNESLGSIINYFKNHDLEGRINTIEQKLLFLSVNYSDIPDTVNQINLPGKATINPEISEYNPQPPPKIAWKCISIIDAHEESITGLAVSNDKQYLFSISWDQQLKIWSIEKGIEIDQISGSQQGLLTVAINQNNYLHRGVATGSLDQDIKIWSLKSKSKSQYELILEQTLTEHNGSIHGLAIAPENNLLISGSYDQTIKIWNLSNGELISSYYDDNGAINALAINDRVGIIASGGGDGTISIWGMKGAGKLCTLVGNLASVESLAISNSGEYVAVGGADGMIKMWYLPPSIFEVFQEVSPTMELKSHHGQVMELIFHPDDQLLYSGGVDGLIKIWYVLTGKELGHLNISDNNRIFSLSLSEDGEILVAGGVNGVVKIWQKSQN